MRLPSAKPSYLYLIFIFVIILTACTPSNNNGDFLTQEVYSQTASVNLVDLSNITPTKTITPYPTNTPTIKVTAISLTPTNTKIVSSNTTTATNTCINKAELIRSLTLNDYVSLTPNSLYAKVWEVMNTGTCTWTSDYRVVFDSGDPFFESSDIFIPTEVNPGETVEIRYNFYAPSDAKIYEGYWIFQDPQKNNFGLGGNFDDKLHFIFVIENKINPTPP